MQYVNEICNQHKIEVQTTTPLSGGDINQVYKITSKKDDYVIKLNVANRHPKMFEAEAKSLQLLLESDSFIIPEVIGYGEHKDKTYLILKHIESSSSYDFAETFAVALAKLHQKQSDFFGLEFDNYIGRLIQKNTPYQSDPISFYLNLRLEPQFKMAHDNGFEFDGLNKLYKTLEQLIPMEKASLIHGDLWSGNYLITDKGEACIFDPAIAYAPREMDIAMMKLFGGYPQEVFKIYNAIFPLESGWESRVSIWQLYYVLAHVNFFGSSYYNQAKRIINQFTA